MKMLKSFQAKLMLTVARYVTSAKTTDRIERDAIMRIAAGFILRNILFVLSEKPTSCMRLYPEIREEAPPMPATLLE